MDEYSHQIDHQLLVRYLSGEATDQEHRQVEDWAAADPKHNQYLEEMNALWQNSALAGDFAAIDVTGDWKKVKSRIDNHRQEENPKAVRSRNLWRIPLLKTAAVAVLAVSIIIGLRSNWKPYFFSNEKVAEATASPVRITLPDGTRVYLNKNSRLTYPETFTATAREVELTGEAFFEVVRNEQKPFSIQTRNVVTRVLGTSFSVNAPAGDSVLVTVLTGKVALWETGRENILLMMTPGETGTYRKGVLKKAINTDSNFLAWKTGVLSFRNTPLAAVIRDLSRYYQRPIQLQSEKLLSCELSSSFDHQTLQEVLSEMQSVLPIGIAIKGDTILLTGNGCR